MNKPRQSSQSRGNIELDHVDQSQVGRQARAGAMWSVLQIVIRNLISIGTTAVLARLLTPDDYGLMGMVATLTALLLVFSDMGLSWATIQKRQLTSFQVSNLFWVNTLAGGLLWLLSIVAAPHVATFYGRAELYAVVVALGANFFVGGIAVQPFALLQRRMSFRIVAEIEVVAMFIAAVAALIAAFAGLGYWALVVQALVSQLIRLLIVLMRSGIVLHRPHQGVGTRQMVSFGGLLAINGILIYLARNIDCVFIGKYWGSVELGYYNRAYFLMMLPSFLATGVLTGLMVPSLAALQGDLDRLGAAYRRAVRIVAFIGCPIAAGLALTAPEAVRLMYGPRWLPVVPMLLWLSIAGITQPIYNTTGWLFTTTGNAKAYLVLTLINASALTITFLIAIRYGTTAVAMGYGLVMGLVLLCPSMWLAHRSANLRLILTAKILLPVAWAVLLMAFAVTVVGITAQEMGTPWLGIFGLKVATGVVVYILACVRWLAPMLHEDVLPLFPHRVSHILVKFLK